MQYYTVFIFISYLNFGATGTATATPTTQSNVYQLNRQQNTEVTTNQLLSSCPDVFSYISVNKTNNSWTGVLHLTTTVSLYGIYVDLTFDRRVSLVEINHYDVTSHNNIEFHIEDRYYRLEVGSANRLNLLLNVFYNSNSIPKLKEIRLNGQIICDIHNEFVNHNPRNSPPEVETSRSVPTNGWSTLIPSINSVVTSRPTTDHNLGNNGNTNNYGRDLKNERSDDNNNPNKNPRIHQLSSKDISQETTKWTTALRTTTKTPSYFEGDFGYIQSGQTTKRIIRPQVNSCGTVVPKANPLLLTGEFSYQGQFPWHAALYLSKGITLKYICGGSLISKNIIITAAHCVAHDGMTKPIDRNNLLIYLGKFYLSKWQQQEQDVKVSEIIINPDYDNKRLYSDIAILRLINEPMLNDFIRPVCLWNMNTDLKLILNKVGTIPGWSISSDGVINDTLSYVKMPIVSHETCIWSNRDFFSQITSDRSFCAGFKNDSSVCNGDSGSGMVFHLNNKYYLRGIVSVSIALQNHLKCDPQHYVVFTDVSKFQVWIEKYL